MLQDVKIGRNPADSSGYQAEADFRSPPDNGIVSPQEAGILLRFKSGLGSLPDSQGHRILEQATPGRIHKSDFSRLNSSGSQPNDERDRRSHQGVQRVK